MINLSCIGFYIKEWALSFLEQQNICGEIDLHSLFVMDINRLLGE